MTAIERLKAVGIKLNASNLQLIAIEIQEIIAELTSPENGYYQIQSFDGKLWSDYLGKYIDLEKAKNCLKSNFEISEYKGYGYKFRIIQVNQFKTIIYEEK